MNSEIWKDIPEYIGYQASNIGRIKNAKTGNILKQRKQRYGYYIVSFTHNKKLVTKTVHRLVAQTFISNPNKLEQVNHIDGNKENNRVENLEWCTQSHNLKEAFRLGLIVHRKEGFKGEKNGTSKIKEYQVIEILKEKAKGTYYKDCCKKFQDIISFSTFQQIWYRQTWKHINLDNEVR